MLATRIMTVVHQHHPAHHMFRRTFFRLATSGPTESLGRPVLQDARHGGAMDQRR